MPLLCVIRQGPLTFVDLLLLSDGTKAWEGVFHEQRRSHRLLFWGTSLNLEIVIESSLIEMLSRVMQGKK